MTLLNDKVTPPPCCVCFKTLIDSYKANYVLGKWSLKVGIARYPLSCMKQHDKAMFQDLTNKKPTQVVLSLAETLVLVCFDRESLIGWLTTP